MKIHPTSEKDSNKKEEISQLGNPFSCTNDSKGLIQLGTKDVMDDGAVKWVFEIEELGKVQYRTDIFEVP